MVETRQDTARVILRIVPVMMRALAMQLRQNQHGLRASHLGVLTMLNAGTHSLTQLAQEMSVSLPTMSNTVSTIEGYGWIERLRDPNNRRQVRIALTQEGRETLRGTERSAIDLVIDALGDMSEAECDELRRGLRALGRCLCDPPADAPLEPEPRRDV